MTAHDDHPAVEPCYCGQPSTQRVPLAQYPVGDLWVTEYEAACDSCSLVAWRELEGLRSA